MKHIKIFENFNEEKHYILPKDPRPRSTDINLLRSTDEYKALIDDGWKEVVGESEEGPRFRKIGEQRVFKDRMKSIGFFNKKFEKKDGYPYYSITREGNIKVALMPAKSEKLNGYATNKEIGSLDMYKEGMKFLLSFNKKDTDKSENWRYSSNDRIDPGI